jgi:hypothetical protein
MKYAPAKKYEQDIKQQKFLIKGMVLCLFFCFLIFPLLLIFPFFITLWVMQFFFAVCDFLAYKDQRRLNYILLTLVYFIIILFITPVVFPFLETFLIYQSFQFILPLVLVFWFYLMTVDDLQAVKGVTNLEQEFNLEFGQKLDEDLLDDIMIQ